MIIRPAQQLDLASIQNCAQQAFEPFVKAIGQAPAPMVADFSGQISAGVLYVALDAANQLAGYIVFFRTGDYMSLESVAVAQSAQGQGLGKRLVGFCENAARDSGCKGVCLYTNEKMTANLSIYPHLGYQETDRRHDEGFSRVFFEKTF